MSRPRRLLATLVVLGVLASGYLGVVGWASTRTAAGASVSGVAVGAMDAGAAARRLQAQLGARADRPLQLFAGSRSGQLVPAQAGLGLDVSATLDQLTGRPLDPRRLWRHLRGPGPAVEPVTRRDAARLAAAVSALARDLDQPVLEGGITFSPAGAKLELPRAGHAIDQRAAADLVAAHWFSGKPLGLVTNVRLPRVNPQVLQRFYDDVARPATSAPLVVRAGERTVVVPVAQLAPALSVDGAASSPGLQVDGAALRKALLRIDPSLERPPVDAQVVLRGTTPTVVPGRDGQRIDPKELAAAALAALGRPDRTARLPALVVRPTLTTSQAQGLGVKELVSTFTTRFPYNPPRTANIRLAARTLHGMLVRPGQVFSLNAALGRRTAAKGYQQAPVIEGNRLKMDYGGGISQVSTTLFNAVFFAGLDTIHHQPHSFYISRYPEGREATISYPTVDQTFRNDSGHGILIATEVTDSEITVSFYGTKVWDIEATKGPRTNLRQPRTIFASGSGCVPQSPSIGFDVTVGRVFLRGGTPVRTERFFTHYVPEDRVICR